MAKAITLSLDLPEEKERTELASKIIRQITPLISGMRSLKFTSPYPSPKVQGDTCQDTCHLGHPEYAANLREPVQEPHSEMPLPLSSLE